jgi:hypothetical protein
VIKYIRLTESDLVKIVNKVIKEQDETSFEEPDPEIWDIVMNNPRKKPEDDGLAEDYDEEIED